MPNPFIRELVFLILHFLDEEKFKETVHKLEKESRFFFNMKYFEEAVINGEWAEIDEYLSGFTKVDANLLSLQIFFEIRKQRYLEALEKGDTKNAVEVLRNDLKFISSFNDDLYKELTLLLRLKDFGENPQLAKYRNAMSARSMVLVEVKKLIESNPLFRDKLQFPSFNNGRFRTLLNQSLNWQHQLCSNPKPNPDITTLLVDHTYGLPSSALASTSGTNLPSGSMPKVGGFQPVGAHAQFQPTSAPVPPTTSVGGWNMDDPSSVPHQVISGGLVSLSTPENAPDEIEKTWELPEINAQVQLRSLRLLDRLLSVKIMRLVYTNSGGALLVLAYNAVHKLWKWQKNEWNLTGKATANVPPQLWSPSSGILMINDMRDANMADAIPCLALSKNDSYILSTSGGKVSLFNMMTFRTMETFMPPPPAATCLAFHPQDNNVIASGMEDSSIEIFNIRDDEVKIKLNGHQKRVTGLAFSNALNILVSSGADAQLCVWSVDQWEKQASKFLLIPSGRVQNPLGQTRLQFHGDQSQLLVIHGTHLAIYRTPVLECIKAWVPRLSWGDITDATYSSDSNSIYATLENGSVMVLSAKFRLRCQISPAAYLPSNLSSRVHPLAIAAHPTEPNQFALGLTDGSVYVLEPLESERKWGRVDSLEDVVGPSTKPAAAGWGQQLSVLSA